MTPVGLSYGYLIYTDKKKFYLRKIDSDTMLPDTFPTLDEAMSAGERRSNIDSRFVYEEPEEEAVVKHGRFWEWLMSMIGNGVDK